MRVCLRRIAILPVREPGEGDLLLIRLNREAFNRQRLFDQGGLGVHQPVQVLQGGVREGLPRQRHRKPDALLRFFRGSLWLHLCLCRFFCGILRLCLCLCGFLQLCRESRLRQPCQNLFHRTAVRAFIPDQGSFFADRKIADGVCAGRHPHVDRLHPDDPGNDLYHLFPAFPCHVESSFHTVCPPFFVVLH